MANEKKITRFKLRHGVVAILVMIGVLALGVARIYSSDQRLLKHPIGEPEQTWTVNIKSGSSFKRITQQLVEANVLRTPRIFKSANTSSAFTRYAKFKRLTQSIQAGTYQFHGAQTPLDVLQQITSGDIQQLPLQLIEGKRFSELLATIHDHPAIVKTLTAETLPAFIESLNLPNQEPEGWFYPDTYLITPNTSDVDFLRRAHQKMKRELDRIWQQRATDIPLKTPYEALILASIIEKETAIAEERPLISGVFTNRLRRGMRLQTDPTVIYGVIHTQGEAAYQGDITRKHLVTDTPYNTYTRAGLPPSPIGAAGSAALRAAVNPATTQALYFVATGKRDGRHVFSNTLTAHNQAVANFLKLDRQPHD